MSVAKIKNVRVHVWTKSETNTTIKQLKEAGFIVTKNNGFPGNTVAVDPTTNEPIFNSFPGLGNLMMVRLDETYWDYNS